jgi:hypothetical protein
MDVLVFYLKSILPVIWACYVKHFIHAFRVFIGPLFVARVDNYAHQHLLIHDLAAIGQLVLRESTNCPRSFPEAAQYLAQGGLDLDVRGHGHFSAYRSSRVYTFDGISAAVRFISPSFCNTIPETDRKFPA